LNDGGVNGIMVNDVEVSWLGVLNNGVINWWFLGEIDGWVSISHSEVSWLVLGTEWLDLGKL